MEDYTIYNILHTATYKQGEYISLEVLLRGIVTVHSKELDGLLKCTLKLL